MESFGNWHQMSRALQILVCFRELNEPISGTVYAQKWSRAALITFSEVFTSERYRNAINVGAFSGHQTHLDKSPMIEHVIGQEPNTILPVFN